jgi:hypothetical protein
LTSDINTSKSRYSDLGGRIDTSVVSEIFVHFTSCILQVLAVDGGKPPRSASGSVVITVQDVNDNDPVFEPKLYDAVVSEDDRPGTPVASVTATDRDENPR